MIVDVADVEHAEPVPLCHPVQAIVHVRLPPASSRQIFEKQVRMIPAVLFAWEVTGDIDYELWLACPDIGGLGTVLTCLRRCDGAGVTSAGLVLHEISGLGDQALATRPGL